MKSKDLKKFLSTANIMRGKFIYMVNRELCKPNVWGTVYDEKAKEWVLYYVDKDIHYISWGTEDEITDRLFAFILKVNRYERKLLMQNTDME